MRFAKLILAVLLVSPLVFAQGSTATSGEKTFTWTPPIEYEDGTPLPQSEIASYDIECDGQLLVNVLNVPPINTYKAPAGTFAVGTHSCEAFTVTIDGVRSKPSNTVNFTVAPGVPNPPVLVVQ